MYQKTRIHLQFNVIPNRSSALLLHTRICTDHRESALHLTDLLASAMTLDHNPSWCLLTPDEANHHGAG